MFTRPIFFDAPNDLGGGGGDAAPGTDTSPEALAAARADFISNPPEIPEIVDDPVGVDDAALESEALAELTTPPAGGPEAIPPVTPAGTPDPYAEFGGRDAVENAMRVDAALRTESGVRLLVSQSLQALGYTPHQIRAALESQPGEEGAPPAAPAVPEPAAFGIDLDDDDYVNGAQLKEIIAQVAKQAAADATEAVRGEVAPTVDAFQAQRQAQASQTADATYVELIGPYPGPDTPELQKEWATQQQAIQQIANQYIDPNDWSPSGIRAALLRGGADYKTQQEAQFTAYLNRKKRDREAAPTNVGGGQPPGSEAPKEPQNLAEAHALAKAAGLFK